MHHGDALVLGTSCQTPPRSSYAWGFCLVYSPSDHNNTNQKYAHFKTEYIQATKIGHQVEHIV